MAIDEPEDRSLTPEVPSRAGRNDTSPWNWLLLLPLVATLLPMFYNREDPKLFGILFFYWYELAAIGIGVASTVIVYLKTRD